MDIKMIEDLVEIIRDRKANPLEKSYTTKLFKKGTNTLVKKLGEENAEFLQAFLVQDDERVASEAADYIYHLIVAMEYRDVPFEKTLDILRQRFKK
jgi:phosphoribosyl-ATP pyrophosphohydrolase/phosphoribosyl-ATP pyrophosphohydrolase/phosphoribosyl-AMP cyclohydrolase